MSFNFSYWLRLCKADNRFIRLIAKLNRIKLTRKYGIQIPETCEIGPGLELPHSLSIVVHYNTRIGKNCTIHQFVTISGDSKGNAPLIGDNCFIGSGAVLIGNIKIAFFIMNYFKVTQFPSPAPQPGYLHLSTRVFEIEISPITYHSWDILLICESSFFPRSFI